jgi:Zn-dependent protease
MLGRPITLFRVLGFPIRVHATALVLGFLLTFSLAGGLQDDPVLGFSALTSWLVAAAVTACALPSLILHELTHSVVARHHGMRVHGITLFLLGGVAEMEDEPRTAWTEFAMAIVGPIASLVIAAFVGAGWWAARAAGWPVAVVQGIGVLAQFNLTIAIFNMIPAYPLDGGRVLRSILWGLKGDMRWATRIASAMGVGFGGVLIAGGLILLVTKGPATSVLMVAVGVFLIAAARMGYRSSVVRGALRGATVRGFVQQDPLGGVPRWIPVSELVSDHLVARQEQLMAVVEGERVLGCVTAADVTALPGELWHVTPVGEITKPCSPANSIGPDATAEEALQRLSRGRVPRLAVIDDGRLAGFVHARDLLAFLAK